jgi:hypothetical protein
MQRGLRNHYKSAFSNVCEQKNHLKIYLFIKLIRKINKKLSVQIRISPLFSQTQPPTPTPTQLIKRKGVVDNNFKHTV